MGKWGRILLFLLIVILIPSVFAKNQLVVNSQNWEDVYSGMLYSNIIGYNGNYIINEGHGFLLQDTFNENDNILVIESVDQPFIRNYDTNLESQGYTTDIIFANDNLNLDLAKRLNVTGYILIDPRYSYNAISVTPYAARKDYYVLFVNNENIGDVVDFLNTNTPQEVILYGYLDQEVTNAMLAFNTVTINKGDKFSNNLEIINRYESEFETKQILLTNGAFIEPQFFQEVNPILFIGQNSVPPQTLSYLQNSKIKYAVLIGYDLFNNAVALKDKVGIKIIVKFAKGVDSKQYALDIFRLPQPQYSIGISSIDFNKYNNQLEISIFNPTATPTFVKSSHTILDNNNNTITVVGDENAIFINGLETITLTYDVDLSSYDSLKIESNILYGEDSSSLEFLTILKNSINFITYEDDSKLDITEAYYNSQTKRFEVAIENTGTVTVFVKSYISDISINNKIETLTTDLKQIEPGSKKIFKIKARLTPEDIEDNPDITVTARYGKRESALIRSIEKTFTLKIKMLSDTLIIGSGAVLIIVIIIIIILLSRKRKKKKSHSHRHSYHHVKPHNLPPPPPPRR